MFVLSNNEIQQANIIAPEMDLETSENYFREKLKIPVLEVGYDEVPKGFRKLKEYQYCEAGN